MAYIELKNINLDNLGIDELSNIYVLASDLVKIDTSFKNMAKNKLLLLQNQNEQCMISWKKICEISSGDYTDLFSILNIYPNDQGESFYNQFIPSVLNILINRNILTKSDDALIYLADNGHHLIFVKSDGGYTYDTTDIAAIWYRLTQLQLTEVIYVTDVGQSQHFNSLFELANKMKWDSCECKLTHIGFGLINIGGSKISSRNNTRLPGKVNVSLRELFVSAINKAKEVSDEKKSIMSTYDKCGLNSIKYFDMTHNYKTSYEYDENRMINFTGNTAIYHMYTYARMCSIITKSKINEDALVNDKFTVSHQIEREICILIFQLKSVLYTLYKTYCFNILTTYIHNLSAKINSYISSKDGRIIGHVYQTSRLLLLLKIKHIYQIVFDILNIELVEIM